MLNDRKKMWKAHYGSIIINMQRKEALSRENIDIYTQE